MLKRLLTLALGGFLTVVVFIAVGEHLPQLFSLDRDVKNVVGYILLGLSSAALVVFTIVALVDLCRARPRIRRGRVIRILLLLGVASFAYGFLMTPHSEYGGHVWVWLLDRPESGILWLMMILVGLSACTILKEMKIVLREHDERDGAPPQQAKAAAAAPAPSVSNQVNERLG